MSRQVNSYGSLSGSYTVDATESAVEESFGIPMSLSEVGNTFTGAYLAVAHIRGRHRNVSNGRVVVNLGTNGVSDGGGDIPDVESPSWQIFEKTIVGQTSADDPAEWSVAVGAEQGEVEVFAASLIVVGL